MKAYTFVVQEATTPLPPKSPHPLIYVVEVEDDFTLSGSTHDVSEDLLNYFKHGIAKQRADDLGVGCDKLMIEQIEDGLELLFAFEGDLAAVMDFRY